MKEVKFRGKTRENNQWVYGFYTYSPSATSFCIIEIGNISPCNDAPLGDTISVYHEVDHKTVGQFTGLKDKNGIEIYEGDICNTHKFGESESEFGGVSEIDICSILEVVWINENMSFGFADKKLIDESQTLKEVYEDYWIFSDDGIEVIGNIYDNPELLKN